jgi:hypothetical protein
MTSHLPITLSAHGRARVVGSDTRARLHCLSTANHPGRRANIQRSRARSGFRGFFAVAFSTPPSIEGPYGSRLG